MNFDLSLKISNFCIQWLIQDRGRGLSTPSIQNENENEF